MEIFNENPNRNLLKGRFIEQVKIYKIGYVKNLPISHIGGAIAS